MLKVEVQGVTEAVQKAKDESESLKREIEDLKQKIQAAHANSAASKQKAANASATLKEKAKEAPVNQKSFFDGALTVKEGVTKLTGRPFAETSAFTLAGVSDLKLKFLYQGWGKAGEDGEKVPRLTFMAPRDRELKVELEVEGIAMSVTKEAELPAVSADFAMTAKGKLHDYKRVCVTIVG